MAPADPRGGTSDDSDQVQPVTVDISDTVEVTADCCEPVEMSIDESQTDYPDGLTQVDVTVHGRVFDPNGVPINGAVVRAVGTGRSTTTDPQGKYSLTYFAQGFGPVDVPHDFELVCSCIMVDPTMVGIGTILPDEDRATYFSVSNSCEKPIEVTMPGPPQGQSSRPDGLSFKIEDCSGGHSSFGSAVQGGGQQATVGPGGRCSVQVRWRPGQETPLDRTIGIPTSAAPSASCRPKVRVVGAAAWSLLVAPRELRFEEVLGVGDRQSRQVTISNLSQHTVTVAGLDVDSPHDTDFMATITSLSNGQNAPGGAVRLAPDGLMRVDVEFAPVGDGVRLSSLIIRTDDPNVKQILVPMSGLAEYRGGIPGTTSTIRQVPTPTRLPQSQNIPPTPTRKSEPPTPRPTATPTRIPETQQQTAAGAGPAQGLPVEYRVMMEDGSVTHLYSFDSLADHGGVLEEGVDIDIEGGDIVFTDNQVRAAFMGDSEGSTVLLLNKKSKMHTGLYTLGTKRTLWARLEEGALAFWEQRRDLIQGPDTGPIYIDLRTPNVKVSLEGTAIWLSYSPRNAATTLRVFEGRAAFQPLGVDLPPVWVEEGFEATAMGHGSPQISVSEGDPEIANWLFDTNLLPVIREVERRR